MIDGKYVKVKGNDHVMMHYRASKNVEGRTARYTG